MASCGWPALPRLAALLEHADGTVSVALAAGVDEQGLRFIEGSLQTEIELVCQRCLGPLRLPLRVTVSLALIRAESEPEFGCPASASHCWPLAPTSPSPIWWKTNCCWLCRRFPAIGMRANARPPVIMRRLADQRRMRNNAQAFAALASLLQDSKGAIESWLYKKP
jgi:hypothetical protein